MEYLEEFEIKNYSLLTSGELDDYGDIIETHIEIGFEFKSDKDELMLMLDVHTITFLLKYPKGDKKEIIVLKPKRSHVDVPKKFPIYKGIKWDEYFNISIDVENDSILIEEKNHGSIKDI